MNISTKERLIEDLEIIANRIYINLRNAGFPSDSLLKGIENSGGNNLRSNKTMSDGLVLSSDPGIRILIKFDDFNQPDLIHQASLHYEKYPAVVLGATSEFKWTYSVYFLTKSENFVVPWAGNWVNDPDKLASSEVLMSQFMAEEFLQSTLSTVFLYKYIMKPDNPFFYFARGEGSPLKRELCFGRVPLRGDKSLALDHEIQRSGMLTQGAMLYEILHLGIPIAILEVSFGSEKAPRDLNLSCGVDYIRFRAFSNGKDRTFSSWRVRGPEGNFSKKIPLKYMTYYEFLGRLFAGDAEIMREWDEFSENLKRKLI